jgi:hypothetical protein
MISQTSATTPSPQTLQPFGYSLTVWIGHPSSTRLHGVIFEGSILPPSRYQQLVHSFPHMAHGRPVGNGIERIGKQSDYAGQETGRTHRRKDHAGDVQQAGCQARRRHHRQRSQAQEMTGSMPTAGDATMTNGPATFGGTPASFVTEDGCTCHATCVHTSCKANNPPCCMLQESYCCSQEVALLVRFSFIC